MPYLSDLTGTLAAVAINPPFAIGRGGECSLVVNDPTVSRLHATITNEDGKWIIANGSDTNPVRVNNEIVLHKGSLTDGDEIQLGDALFVFTIDIPDRQQGHRGDPTVRGSTSRRKSQDGEPTLSGRVQQPGGIGQVLQFVGSSQRSGRLVLHGGGLRDAIIEIVGNQVVRMACGKLLHADVIPIIALRNYERFDFWDIEIEGNPFMSLQQLLMTAAKILDDERRLAGQNG